MDPEASDEQCNQNDNETFLITTDEFCDLLTESQEQM